MTVTTWRRWVLTLFVSVIAVGWSVRPKPLDSSDLYGAAANNEPTLYATSVTSDALVESVGTPEMDAQPRLTYTINWDLLRTLNYSNGSMSNELRNVNGKRVRVPGFIVPLDDFQDEVTEFLLVPYFGACVHTPPPPPNQLVFVRLSGKKQKVSLFEPVWIEGVLTIKNYQSVYGAVGFQVSAERITPYR